MENKQPTINDVARLAGVSKATVSAVLNETGTVKDSTRDRVESVIEHLNYRKRGFAARGTGQKGRSIGLIIKEIDNPYYGEVAAGVRAAANDSGYTLLVTSSEGEYEAERRAVEVLQAKDIDGLIVTPVLDGDADLSHLFELKRRNFPFALLEQIRGVPASLVDIDNVEASHKAVEFLIEQGHTRVVHFAGPAYSTHSEERINGVRRACSGSRVIFTDDDIVPAGAHIEDGYRAGLEYFRSRSASDRPTAVTCYNDLVALGLCRALSELGIGVPADVSVVGFDDLELLAYLPVPLTTVRIPKIEMGRIAAEILIRQIESGEPMPPQKVYLQAEMVVRQSTRSLRGDAAPLRASGDETATDVGLRALRGGGPVPDAKKRGRELTKS